MSAPTMPVPSVTKRPKTISLTFEKVYALRSTYQCPSCTVVFIMGGPTSKNVVRFICTNCGQELIVGRVIDRIEGREEV
jgi:predicted RNA-binding Zn-ribbon protein involved in translation (DUF1610 family)